MKTNKNQITNLQKMDKSLDKILHQVVSVIAARKENQNAYDDDLKETWGNFRTVAEQFKREVDNMFGHVLLEENEEATA